MRAERGNPVWVRPPGAGKPTVRNAQSLGGNRMIEKRTPVAERQQETGTRWLASPLLLAEAEASATRASQPGPSAGQDGEGAARR